jgi:hypothetical protein
MQLHNTMYIKSAVPKGQHFFAVCQPGAAAFLPYAPPEAASFLQYALPEAEALLPQPQAEAATVGFCMGCELK